jgi:putative nucleotide binding protein
VWHVKADKKEINAIVLDVLMKGHPDDPRPPFKREPIVQAMGIEQFKLLELVPKTNALIDLHDKVYIGDSERDKIERVKRRIGYDELTHTAKGELPFIIEKVVKEREQDFVAFFNKAISITPKLHMLHLLPGIGKKLMWELLEARTRKPFESFADISTRIKSIPHPEKMIQARILEELQEKDLKYHVFTSK